MVANEKVLKLEAIKKMVSVAKAVYFADCSKIPATEITSLRHKLYGAKVKLKVINNRITKKALNETGISGIDEFFKGPTALVIAYDDPLIPARLLKEFKQKNTNLKIKGAFLENLVYKADQFDYLANMPSKPELLGELVGCLQSPITSLVFTLEGLIRQLIGGLEELKEIKLNEHKNTSAQEQNNTSA